MPAKKAEAGELALIRWLKKNLPVVSRRVRIPIGDDCAVVSVSRDNLVALTTDMILEGTHFQIPKRGADSSALRRIGRKAVAVSLSDVAAMGLAPSAVVISVALPEEKGLVFAQELFRGMRKIAKQFQVDIIGGDITSWEGKLAICTTVLGRDVGLKPIRRSGARVGDAILVTGKLGGSSLGKHLRFTPRVEEALFLNRNFKLHAMIDVSDGLALDLSHILEESGCGAVLREDAIPVSSAARRLSKETGKLPLEHALGDGEDFELLLALSPGDLPRLLRGWKFKLPLTPIGQTTSKGLFLKQKDGTLKELKPLGWEHLRAR